MRNAQGASMEFASYGPSHTALSRARNCFILQLVCRSSLNSKRSKKCTNYSPRLNLLWGTVPNPDIEDMLKVFLRPPRPPHENCKNEPDP
jgi:hypothetical protein